jgi:hypothetical protein
MYEICTGERFRTAEEPQQEQVDADKLLGADAALAAIAFDLY